MPKPIERKTEFWWASIHGSDPEPVEKTEHDGRSCVYTLGCADPFYLDEIPCAVRLVSGGRGDVDSDGYKAPQLAPMQRPYHPDRDEAAAAARRSRMLRYNAAHGWRGPR